jgi:hypothetical protein
MEAQASGMGPAARRPPGAFGTTSSGSCVSPLHIHIHTRTRTRLRPYTCRRARHGHAGAGRSLAPRHVPSHTGPTGGHVDGACPQLCGLPSTRGTRTLRTRALQVCRLGTLTLAARRVGPLGQAARARAVRPARRCRGSCAEPGRAWGRRGQADPTTEPARGASGARHAPRPHMLLNAHVAIPQPHASHTAGAAPEQLHGSPAGHAHCVARVGLRADGPRATASNERPQASRVFAG